jgi:thiol:disulfide interchange protein DsbD
VIGGTTLAAILVPASSRSPGAAVRDATAAHDASFARAWEPWSQQRVDELRQKGTPVFVDFTATWCLSCQVNERVALDNPAVREELKRAGVAALRADWTDSNDAIARALAGFGRASVPLYVFYPSGGADPVILPEILTPGIVLGVIAPR